MIYMGDGEDISHMEMWINGKKTDVGKYGCDKNTKSNEIERKEN